MNNMFTSENLEEYSERKVKELIDNNFNKDSIAPLFLEDGEFNTDNWNGGDAIIRQFLCHLEDNCSLNEVYKSAESDVVLICNYIYDDDDKRTNITRVCRDKDNTVSVTDFRFGWYKNRGNLDYAEVNDEPMLLSQYIELLNDIEVTNAFKFDTTTII